MRKLKEKVSDKLHCVFKEWNLELRKINTNINNYLVAAILRLKNSLENTENWRLEYEPWHFAIPGYSMKHLGNVMIHFVCIFVKLLQQNQHCSHDFYIGKS